MRRRFLAGDVLGSIGLAKAPMKAPQIDLDPLLDPSAENILQAV